MSFLHKDTYSNRFPKLSYYPPQQNPTPCKTMRDVLKVVLLPLFKEEDEQNEATAKLTDATL